MTEDLFDTLLDNEPVKEPTGKPRQATAHPQMQPLAERLRPERLDEVVGQRHLLDPGNPFAWPLMKPGRTR